MAETMDTEGCEQVDSNSMYGTLAAFNIDKKIGKGQFSEVYRVICKATGNVLALKKVQVTLAFLFCKFFVTC
jgi:serine/threonine protein kinase